MEIFILAFCFVVISALVVYNYVRERNRPPPLTRAERKGRYQEASSNVAREALIAEAKSPDELDLMAEAWVDRGISTEGLLYANILRAKQAKGGKLSALDEERIRRSEQAVEAAKDLPVIRGRGRN